MDQLYNNLTPNHGFKVMFTSLSVPFFREFIFKTNLMRNQEKPFRIRNKLSLVRAQAQLHKKKC
jgi:hypothetical protein